jgi:hypothetical protein
MDPNETLRRLRELARRDSDHPVYSPEWPELFQALDQWISRGGLLPDAWRKEAR